MKLAPSHPGGIRLVLLASALVGIWVASFSVRAQADADGDRENWLHLATTCIRSSEAQLMFEDAETEVFAFACGVGGERVVFMFNLSNEKQRVERTGEVEPLVPIFSSDGNLAAIPSIVVTLPGDGTVIHSNPIPPRTVVVFRPIRERDIRPHELDE